MTRNPARATVRGGALTLGGLRVQDESQPGGRTPAPGELALVQAFVNTFWDLDLPGEDQLASPSELTGWLADRSLLDPEARLTRADLRRALDVREGLRALLFANNGAPADRDAVARLNRALSRPGVFVRLDHGAPPDFVSRRRDLDGALALMGTIVALAQLDGRWTRLKACRGEHCGWAFYDHSRNQTGSWCAMSVCGSRSKARQYRRRKRRSRAPSA